jgi:flagellar biosynthesis GTPase FlhF
MKSRKNRFRRRPPAEKEKDKPFFDKQPIKEKTAFFGSAGIQPKLSIGKSDDPQEKEAESTARQMTAQPVQKAEKKEEEKPVQKAEKKEEEKPVQKEEKKEEEKPVQKEEKKEEPVQKAEKKEEEKPVQKAEKKEEEKPVQKAEKKEEEKPVQKAEKKEEDKPVQKAAKKESGDNEPGITLEQLLASRKGRGFKLPDEVRAEMEKKFDTHFGEVRIHTDKEAEEICEQLHAMAFTHGCDIYFNAGQYNPDAATGKELLAHELTHVVQQNY